MTERGPSNRGLARPRMAALTASLVFGFSLATLFSLDPLDRPEARVAMAAIALLALTVLAAALIRWNLGRQRRGLARATILAHALGCAFLAAEIVFSFVPRSNGNANALAMRKWMAEYWKPINRLGFRDADVAVADLEHKRKILVVGDSFVAGHGVED
ncbi:MAG: hypothetical protein ACREQ9_19845, partial [Candidatus Binatia bacterium]